MIETLKSSELCESEKRIKFVFETENASNEDNERMIKLMYEKFCDEVLVIISVVSRKATKNEKRRFFTITCVQS